MAIAERSSGPVDVAAGIDIGGTNTALGFVDRNGCCLEETSIPTGTDRDPSELIRRVHQTITDLLGRNTRRVLVGIGIGAPNANFHKGTVESPPNLPWRGIVNLADHIRRFQDCPVAVTNDANAAAVGEMKFGAARGMRDFIVITLGTGLGSGLVANGELILGHDGFAGEIGHTVVDPNGRECGCGKRGCLETYASANGIRRTVAELLCERRADSALRSIAFRDLTARMISEAAHAGDPIALEAFERAGRALGMKLADAVAHTSPEAIILFGGLAAAGELIFEPAKRHMEANLLPVFRGKVKVLPSGLNGGSTAVLGAAALIWNELAKRG